MTDLSTELAITSSNVSLTTTSLEVKGDMDYDRWEDLVTKLMVTEKSVAWWIGDLLNYGESRYGEKYNQAIEMTGRSVSTLRNWLWVAKQFPPETRRDTLSWSIHRELAPLDPEERKKWLDAVEEEQWSRGELRYQLSVTPDGDSPEKVKPLTEKADLESDPLKPEVVADTITWVIRITTPESGDIALVDTRVRRAADGLRGVLVQLKQDPTITVGNDVD